MQHIHSLTCNHYIKVDTLYGNKGMFKISNYDVCDIRKSSQMQVLLYGCFSVMHIFSLLPHITHERRNWI
uniref:Uncharacterized protein n=1 Tax=Arundo donax TaxID=35708 RepID=A0A0A9E472_ARUDO